MYEATDFNTNYNSDMTTEIKPGPSAILQTGFQTL